jgi:hypothetical protein
MYRRFQRVTRSSPLRDERLAGGDQHKPEAVEIGSHRSGIARRLGRATVT